MPRARKSPPQPHGRPRVAINWEEVDKWLRAGCTGTEVASCLCCSPDTLYERCLEENGAVFSAYKREKLEQGNKLLREAQQELALNKDKTMLVWLGKNRLGQRDAPPQVELNPELLTHFNSFMQSIQVAQEEQKARDVAKTKENVQFEQD